MLNKTHFFLSSFYRQKLSRQRNTFVRPILTKNCVYSNLTIKKCGNKILHEKEKEKYMYFALFASLTGTGGTCLVSHWEELMPNWEVPGHNWEEVVCHWEVYMPYWALLPSASKSVFQTEKFSVSTELLQTVHTSQRLNRLSKKWPKMFWNYPDSLKPLQVFFKGSILYLTLQNLFGHWSQKKVFGFQQILGSNATTLPTFFCL